MIIYKITNKLTGDCYIGQTTRTLEARWKQHCRETGCVYLSNAIQKYGKDAFSLDTIAEYDTIEDLNNAEEYYISWYNSLRPNGYNLRPGGKNQLASEETRVKMSKAHMGNTRRKGIPHTKETKEKIASSLKGSKNHNFGKPLTEERKFKLAEGRRKSNKLRKESI